MNGLTTSTLDGAVVSSTQPTVPWLPRPILARSSEEAVEAAGSRYCYSAGITILSDAAEEGLKQLAFVGLPCQVLALRKMQSIGLKKIVGRIKLIIGLFCSESFTYEGLVQKKISQEMGVNLNDITKMNIKGAMQIRLKNGQMREIPLKELHQYAEPFCRSCDDFSSELADISLGGVGLENETFIIPRTEVGRTFLEEAVKMGTIDLVHPPKEKAALGLLIRLSKSKRDRSLKERLTS
jgi:coenzyme F420 hydrogenase subunit beta